MAAAAAAATAAADEDGEPHGLSDDEVAAAMADICCDQLMLAALAARLPVGDALPDPSEPMPSSGSIMRLPVASTSAAAVSAAVADDAPVAAAAAAAAAADTDAAAASDDVDVMGDDDVMAGDAAGLLVLVVLGLPLPFKCVETACCMPTVDMPNDVPSMWAGDQMDAGLALKEPPPPEKLCGWEESGESMCLV